MKRDMHQRLRRLREAMGLTQREIATELGVTKGAIAFWELDLRPIPGPVEKLIRIYEAELGLDGARGGDLIGVEIPVTGRGWSAVAKLVGPSLSSLLRLDSGRNSIALRARLAVVRRLVERLGTMPGFGAKVAQMLHGYAFAMPRPLGAPFFRVPQPPAMRASMVADIVTRELGGPPRQLFAAWEPVPFATASIGQVHRARLHEGDEVAVKVQYPKVVGELERDLRAMDGMNGMFELLFPYQTPRILVRAAAERVLAECDYRREAADQERFRSAFLDWRYLRIPKIYPELTSTRVLTSEIVAGETVDLFAAHASEPERRCAGETIWRFALTMMLQHETMLADPHPSNFLVDGRRLTVLDFGRCFSFRRGFVASWKRLIAGMIAGDRATVDALTLEWGIPGDLARFDFAANYRMLLVLCEPWLRDRLFTFDGEFMRRQWRAVWLENPNRFIMNFSVDPASLHEFHFGLYGTLARMGARANWHRILRSFLD